MDLYVTFTELAVGKLPGDRIIDGKNIEALLFNVSGAKSPYDAFYYYDGPQLQAIRSGKWKLYLPLEKKVRTEISQEIKLFDVVEDPGETKDLKKLNPKIVKEILQFSQIARKDLGDGNGIMDHKGTGQRSVGRVDNPTPRVPECCM
jgi:arylsulfatase A-like enzyme